MVNEEVEFKESEFNEALFEMRRHDTSQTQMNLFKLNLQFFNEEFSNWNFNLHFLALTNLFQESPKILKTTKEEIIKMKEVIEKFIDEYLKYMKKNKLKMYETNDHFNNLKKALFRYEDLIRTARDLHGYSSPTKMSEGMF